MARRSKSNKGRRDSIHIANPLLPFLMDDIPIIDFEDRRRHSPVPIPFPVSFPDPTRVVVRKRPRSYQHSLKKNLSKSYKSYLAQEFHAPDNVLICVRRKRRKEVLHALGKSGKRGQRKPRWSSHSDVHC